MKFRTTLALSAAVIAAGVGAGFAPHAASVTTVAPLADAYAIDPVHSTVLFRTKHMNVSYFYGNMRDFSGQFTLDPASADGASISVEIKAAGVDTHNQKRDDHLRSADFFNVDQFPTATFKSTSFKKTGEGKFDCTGEFTLCGVTKTITVPVEHTGSATDPRAGARAGLETVFTINRQDYGITFMPDGLGNDVRLIISLEGVKK